MPSSVFVRPIRRGAAITAEWLNSLARAVVTVLFGGNGITIQRVGNKAIISGGQQRLPADPVTPRWLPFGFRGGGFTDDIRRSSDITRQYRAINAVEKAAVIATDPDVFAGKWGAEGVGNGQFTAARGCAFLGNNTVLCAVTDSVNGGVSVFYAEEVPSKWDWVTQSMTTAIPQGQFFGKFVDDGSGRALNTEDVAFSLPAFDSLGGVEIEAWHTAVSGPEHDVLRGFWISGSATGAGAGDGEFDTPRGVASTASVVDPESEAIDPAGVVVVADTGNDRVQVFELVRDPPPSWGSFVFLREFGTTGAGNGQFSGPWGIAIDDTYIWVADSGNDRVQKFLHDGTHQLSFGTPGAGNGQFDDPRAIAVDPVAELVYVCDTGNDRFQVFDYSGNFIRATGSSGTGDGQLDSPQGIAYSRDRVLVSDTGNNRMQLFKRSEGAQTEWFRYTSVGPFSLGEPDGGVAVPAPTALARTFTDDVADPVEEAGTDILSRQQLIDARNAVEAIAPRYVNEVTGNPFNWTPNSVDNLYYVTFGSDSDWHRSFDEMLNTDTFDIDINEIKATVDKLEDSSLIP